MLVYVGILGLFGIEVMFLDCSLRIIYQYQTSTICVGNYCSREPEGNCLPSLTFVDVTFRVVKQTLSTSDLRGTVEGKENLRESRMGLGMDTGTHGDTHNQ